MTHSRCYEGTCLCLPGYKPVNQSTACILRQIGDNCTLDDDCSYAVIFSHCVVTSSTCVCNSGRHTINDDTTSCFLRKIGDGCSTDSDCSDAVANSYCDITSCKCLSGYYVTLNGTTCTRRRVSDECYLPSDCADAVTNSYCHREILEVPTTVYSPVALSNNTQNYTIENGIISNFTDPNTTNSDTYHNKSGIHTNFTLSPSQPWSYNSTVTPSISFNTAIDEPGLNQKETLFGDNNLTTVQGTSNTTNAFRDKRSAAENLPDKIEETYQTGSNKMQFRAEVIIENVNSEIETSAPTIEGTNMSTVSKTENDIFEGHVVSTINESSFENVTIAPFNDTVNLQIENNTFYDNFTFAQFENETEVTREMDIATAFDFWDGTGKCACLPGYRIGYNGTTCIKRVIGDSCTVDMDCMDAVTNSRCSDITFIGKSFQVCMCDVGLKAIFNRSECIPRLIGESCVTNLDCTSVRNSTCPSDTYLCECEEAFYPSNDNATCILRKVGDHCEVNTQCSSAVDNSMCSIEKCNSGPSCQKGDYLTCSTSRMVCSCQLGYHSKNNGTICEKRESSYINICVVFLVKFS